MPTLLHVLLLGLVPMGNAWVLWKLAKNPDPIGPWHRAVIAFNTGTSLLHADVCPGHPHQFHAHYCLRHGLPITPLVTFLAGLRLWKHVQAAQVQPSRPWTLGMVAAIACLLALESPYFLTRLGLRWADAEDRSVH